MDKSAATEPTDVEQLAASAEPVVKSPESRQTAEASPSANPLPDAPSVPRPPKEDISVPSRKSQPVESQAARAEPGAEHPESRKTTEASPPADLVPVDPAVAGPSSNEDRPEPRVHSLPQPSRNDVLNGHDTPAQETADVALMAAHDTRIAAGSCRTVLGVSVEALNRGMALIERALRRAEGEVFFQSLAQKYETAISNLSRMANELQVAAESAAAAASSAEEAANALVNAAEQGVDEEDKKWRAQDVIWSVTTTNAAAITAYRMEFSALMEARRRWQTIQYFEDRGSDFERRLLEGYDDDDDDDVQPGCDGGRDRSCCFRVVACVTFILGVLVLAARQFIYFSNSQRYETLLFLGIMLVASPVVYAFWDLFRCHRNRRRLPRVSQAQHMIDRIEARLKELSQYFVSHGLAYSFHESGNEEEQG